jgi:hypothetical protein
MRRRNSLLIILIVGNVLGLLTGELLVRALGNTDADGNFRVGGKIRGPEQPQLTRLTSLVEEFEARTNETLFVYDAELGWILRPGAVSENGLFGVDERGIRTGARARREGPIVALYGGSVTFCTGVSYDESWGGRLEELLAETGNEHRVVNLGVGAYDMGQAYLRWRSTHPELRPEIVIFGLSPENLIGNVSIIRAFHYPTTRLPFSKPRFVLEGDELGIVNVPCLPPRDVLAVLRDPRGWELLPLETFYVEGERERSLWQHSRLLCLLLDKVGGRTAREQRRACYRSDSQAFQLAVRIVQRFHDEVLAAGSRFVIVHLPNESQFDEARSGRPMPQAALLAELARRGMTVVDPTPELVELAEREGPAVLFGLDQHFSPSSNRAIAEVLAQGFAK